MILGARRGNLEPYVIARERLLFRSQQDDHAPPHLHVFKGEWEAKIALGNATVRPWVMDPGRMPGYEIREAVRIVLRNQAQFLGDWRNYHG